jgi:hypothetical protein
MTIERDFERITPNAEVLGDATNRPWVIVLSDWPLPSRLRELAKRLDSIFGTLRLQEPLPTVFVVDDISNRDIEHWQLLRALTEGGATVLEPADGTELAAAQRDPLRFAAQQLPAPVGTTDAIDSPPPPPSQPDGYKAFAIPSTRLAPDALESLVKGQRPKGWQYEE